MLKTLKGFDLVLTDVEKLARPPHVDPKHFGLLDVEPLEGALPVLTSNESDLNPRNHPFVREPLTGQEILVTTGYSPRSC